MLRMWFYDPSSDKEGILNKFVSYFDGPFCHCEIQFENDAACSIVMGNKTRMCIRKFDKSAYTCVHVPCHRIAHDSAYNCAVNKYQQAQQFSIMGMLGAGYQRDTCEDDRTFCSKLCVEILQAANLFHPNLKAGSISPSRLHALLQQRHADTKNVKVAAIGFK